MIIYFHRTTSGRTTCIEQITSLKREELADIRNNFINLIQHITSTSLLHFLTIDVKMEMKHLYILKLLYINPITYDSRAIKAFGNFPWLSSSLELSLQFSSRKINTHRNSIIITRCETSRNRLAQLIDSHHNLCFVFNPSHKVWNEKRMMVFQQ